MIKKKATNELKPCPFCGEKVGIDSDYSKTNFYKVHHEIESPINWECPINAGIFIHGTSKDEAIKRWNRRAENV